MTTSDPGYHALYDDGGHLAVQLPRSELSALLPDIESRLMRPFPPDSDALKLIIAYAKDALDLDPGAGHELQRQVAAHLRDLVVFLAGPKREAEVLVARSVAAARLRTIKSEIEARSDSAICRRRRWRLCSGFRRIMCASCSARRAPASPTTCC